MAKIDKSKYTKQEWRVIRERRKFEKRLKEELKDHEARQKYLNKLSGNFAFVLGNGTSRRSIDLNEIKNFGTVYGCNALYREFTPDYLIAVDVKMIIEINRAGYQNTNTVWTNYNRTYKSMQNFKYFEPSRGWSSGPTALWLASQHGYRQIYILGFDYKGLDNGKLVNNIYADTPNYKRNGDPATYHGNWLRQTKAVIKEHPHIKYFRVIQPDNWCPPELNNLENLETITIDQFKSRLF